LEEPIDDDDWETWKMAKNSYKACMNLDKIEEVMKGAKNFTCSGSPIFPTRIAYLRKKQTSSFG